MIEKILKFKFIFIALIIAVACYLYVRSVGNEYVCMFYLSPGTSQDTAPEVYIDGGDKDCIEVVEIDQKPGEVYVRVRSNKPGKVLMGVKFGDNYSSLAVLFIHKDGIITDGDFFGIFTGSSVVRAGMILFFFLIVADFIFQYRKSVRSNIYSYNNILLVGLIVFLAANLVMQIFSSITVREVQLYTVFADILNVSETFVLLTFPIAIVAAILTTVSNIQLLRKEGRTWRNTLGIILGLVLCIASVTPFAVAMGLSGAKWIDIHRWTGTGRFVGMFIEYTAGIIASYFVCILIGSIVVSLKAARHVPAFDKDYIVINGCQIRKDGTLTKLLQSRTDRAIEFASMQKKATGKDIIFVPSGGKGSDEVISEAEAIGNYLREQGIPESAILLEDKSTTTLENFKNSAALIRERGPEDAKIAFSTTNYHVFRSGMLARSAGIKAEGIGSPTKSYFWVNAFIREFVATIVYERKKHILVFVILELVNLAAELMIYFSNVVLSYPG